MKQVPAAIILIVAALCCCAGCSNRAERLYQRAEAFFVQGQPNLAAAEYYRLVTEEPRSSLADAALYKLAFLYREEFRDAPAAIKTYETLANRYPNSPYTDDALLWVLQIQGEDLKDAAGVRQTCDVIRQRFPDDARINASAQLQLANTLLTTGKLAEADAVARALSGLYPLERRQAAGALLVRARVLEKQGQRGDEAVKLYAQIVDRYPDTPGAAEAKRAIGWLYYGLRNTQMAQERLAKLRAARVITDVPPPAAVTAPRLRPFACLASLMNQRGVRVTPEELLIVSGAAFEFLYRSDQPQAMVNTLARNALTLAAEQYGFATNVWSAASADASFASLSQAIAQGRPVMAPASDGNWLIVTGYKPAEDRVYVLAPGQTQPQTMSRAHFIGRWSANGAGHTDCVSGPYFQFSLGQRTKAPGLTTLLRSVAQRAVESGRRRELGELASGVHAYDQLAQDLLTANEGLDPQRLEYLREWSAISLPEMMAERRAVAEFLTTNARSVGGEMQNQFLQAAAGYQEVSRLGMDLRRTLAELLGTTTGTATWQEAADHVRQMRAAEESALGHMASVAG